MSVSPARNWLAELPQYFIASCGGLAIDTGTLLLLNSVLKIPYLIAATISFLAGGVVGYLLCVRFVWQNQTAASKASEVALFILTGVVGLGINSIVIVVMVSGAHSSVLIGKGAAAGCTFFCNYMMRRRWVFPRATRRIISWLPATDK